MDAFLDAVLLGVQTVNKYLSDYILIILLIGVGLYFTIRTRFVQVRCFGEGCKQMFGGMKWSGEKHGKSGMSSFQALATAIAAQVGTGNIVGACGAILLGGPGAIFWMWVIAFFGMATIYAEATLAQKTKTQTPDGEVVGGPAYYIRAAFKGKFGKILAVFFAVACVLALGFMGGMVQSNSIGEAFNTAFSIPTWVSGLVVVLAAGLIFLGGIQRIASVTEKIVPVMAALYIIGCLTVLAVNIKDVPEAFGLIFKYAFNPTAILGGGVGFALKAAISQGAKRGLFSNEAGMGSTPHAHAVAKVDDPHKQGVSAMIGVFIDTFVVLTMTALVVITMLFTANTPLGKQYTDKIDTLQQCKTDVELAVEYNKYYLELLHERTDKINGYDDVTVTAEYNAMYEALTEKKLINEEKVESVALQKGKLYEYIAIDEPVLTGDELTVESATEHIYAMTLENEGLSKTNAMQYSMTNGLPKGISGLGNGFVAICLFFFAFSTIVGWYFFGKQNMIYLFGKKSVVVYTVISLIFVFIGSLLSNDLVWELTDMFNQLMVLPNALALIVLGGAVAAFAKKKKANK